MSMGAGFTGQIKFKIIAIVSKRLDTEKRLISQQHYKVGKYRVGRMNYDDKRIDRAGNFCCVVYVFMGFNVDFLWES